MEGIVHYVRMRHDSARAQLKRQGGRCRARSMAFRGAGAAAMGGLVSFGPASGGWRQEARGRSPAAPRNEDHGSCPTRSRRDRHRGITLGQEVPGPVHALFQRRVAGDEALLKLAGLRFAQMGVAAEVYADTPDQLDHVLRFVPAHARRPMVHLNRSVNVLHERGRAVVAEFADRFAGRVAGLVVHDKREMGAQTDRLLAAMRELDARLCERRDGPIVFLEYAAGLDRGWFVEVAERLQDAERVSCCIDVGHIGLRQASARFGRRHPGLGLKNLGPADGRLPDLVADVQDAVGAALPHVLDVTARSAGSASRSTFTCTTGIPSSRACRITSAS